MRDDDLRLLRRKVISCRREIALLCIESSKVLSDILKVSSHSMIIRTSVSNLKIVKEAKKNISDDQIIDIRN